MQIDKSESNKEKLIYMLNDGKLKSKSNDIAYWDKEQSKFGIKFCNLNNDIFNELDLKYLNTFEIME